MSAANWFIGVGLFAVAAAGGGIAWRHEEVVVPTLSCPAPVVNVPAQAAPVVNVAPAPVQVSPARESAPAPARVGEPAPAPARARVGTHKKPTARKRLQTKWSIDGHA
jgi:hypothetical protein